MKFLVEAHKVFGHLVPAHDFGYSYLEVADYHNWTTQSRCDDVLFLENTQFPQEYLTKDCIPVGSLDFCLAWYRQMGCAPILPLNIPQFLDPFIKRDIIRTQDLANTGRQYFGKSMQKFKSDKNGLYTEYHGTVPMLFTEYVQDICSEWRVFVCNGLVEGLRCYSGTPLAVPDMGYCDSIVRAVDANWLKSYTADLMVRKSGVTDVVELHDFFACGLYGFSDPVALRRMAILTQRKLLGGL